LHHTHKILKRKNMLKNKIEWPANAAGFKINIQTRMYKIDIDQIYYCNKRLI